MAKQILPTDFQDDVLSEGALNRRKYVMISNGDGTVSFDDVTDYFQRGSTFGAAQVNQTNEAVNNSVGYGDIVDNFLSDATDLPASARTVKELNNKFQMYTLTYAEDLFSYSQCLCARSGNVVHVYISLKTGTTLTQGQVFTLTGHPPVPLSQAMRIIDLNAASTNINVTNDGISISVDRAFSPDAWIRFAFSYICS